MFNTILHFSSTTIISERSETVDPHGNPIQWVPYGVHSPTKQPQLYAKYVIPLNMDRFELGFGVHPLPSTMEAATASTSATSVATTTSSEIPDFTPEILDVAELPAHLAPHFAPKLIRVQNVVRLVQYRFDEQQRKFCWHTMSQPLRDPSATIAKPSFRISCPHLDRKFDFESVFWFLRHYNVRKDGTYYRATPETIADGRGYGKHGAIAPDTECKYSILFVDQQFINFFHKARSFFEFTTGWLGAMVSVSRLCLGVPGSKL